MGGLCDPSAWTDEAIGEIPASVEVKLVDEAELGYFTNKKQPQGEIWIRGGSVTDGYLDLPEETKESFTDDGWFKTGDIGEFDAKGHLKIIDRKKNLVKTMNGEYIALEKVCLFAAPVHLHFSCRSTVPLVLPFALESQQKPSCKQEKH